MARYRIAGQLGALRAGDIPGALVLELEAVDDGAPVALDGITGAAAELVDPAGTVAAYAAAVDVAADTITVSLPNALTEPGLWALELTVSTATSAVHVEPAALVVEAVRDGWHTLASARGQWADAPRSDVALHTFLAGAREQCLDYGPPLEAGARPPLAWQQAQLMQARNCWNAAKTDPASGGIGGDELVFRPYPMDATIRYLIRPRRAVGAIA